MRLFQTGLVHVLMSVLGTVVVGVGVLMCDVVVLMGRVRMNVRHLAMVVFVRVRYIVGVLLGHSCYLLVRNILYLLVIHLTSRRVRALGGPDDSATAFSPPSAR